MEVLEKSCVSDSTRDSVEVCALVGGVFALPSRSSLGSHTSALRTSAVSEVSSFECMLGSQRELSIAGTCG